jgi:hypothetical protein
MIPQDTIGECIDERAGGVIQGRESLLVGLGNSPEQDG